MADVLGFDATATRASNPNVLGLDVTATLASNPNTWCPNSQVLLNVGEFLFFNFSIYLIKEPPYPSFFFFEIFQKQTTFYFGLLNFYENQCFTQK
jgi:hypothetical protein